MRKNHGFTLIEIMVVLIIIGIATAMILPNLNNSVELTKAQAAQNNLLAISAAQGKYYEDNSSYCVQVGCGDTNSNLNSGLHLGIPASDPFQYSCQGAVSPTLYTCQAVDGTVTETITATNSGIQFTCSPTPSSICPS